MAIPKETIKSITLQLDTFGDDGVAFDAWINSIRTHLRTHVDVGQFRTLAKTMWLSGNKRGVKSLVSDILSGRTLAEASALEAGELGPDTFARTFIQFLAKMGICKGDTLTVHDADGVTHSITFDQEGLPARSKTANSPSGPSLLLESD